MFFTSMHVDTCMMSIHCRRIYYSRFPAMVPKSLNCNLDLCLFTTNLCKELTRFLFLPLTTLWPDLLSLLSFCLSLTVQDSSSSVFRFMSLIILFRSSCSHFRVCYLSANFSFLLAIFSVKSQVSVLNKFLYYS